MYWNYRIVKLTNSFDEPYYEIHEVHYNDDHTIYDWTESHNLLVDDTVEELKESYEYMSSAFDMPILQADGTKLIELTDG